MIDLFSFVIGFLVGFSICIFAIGALQIYIRERRSKRFRSTNIKYYTRTF